MKNLLRVSCYAPFRPTSERSDRRRLASRLFPGVIFLLAFLAAGVQAAEPGEGAAVNGELYARVKQASLEILVDDHLNGSGSLVDASGLAITAAHVIGRPGNRVEVLSPVAGRRRAEVAAVDMGHDLALLRLEPRDGGYPYLPLADPSPPAGADVFLLGTPVFRHAVMFRGMVARDEPTFEYLNAGYVVVLPLAANVPSGTSGGPWVDGRGALVGVQSGIMSNNGTPVGVAFAGTAGAVRRLMETRQTAATPNLGAAIEETWQQGREFLDRFPPRTEGLVVKVLQADGPAARAGLKQWDLILEAEGQAVRLPDELLRIVRQKKPGETFALTVLGPDGTGKRQVAVTLGRLEAAWPEPGSAGKKL